MILEGIEAEFEGAELGDRRLEYRLPKIAKALQYDPDVSIPEALQDDASVEGTYRLLRNKGVFFNGILSGHYQQTIERAAEHKCVLAIHDTSPFKFSGGEDRQNLGPMGGKRYGFFGHFTLLAAVGKPVVPLGVLAFEAVVRSPKDEKPKEGEEGSEFARWARNVRTTEQRLGGRCSVIHVMDREGDDFGLMAEMIENAQRFVIRSRHDRFVGFGDGLRVSHMLATTKATVKRTVVVSKRGSKNELFDRKQPARETRVAKLALSAIKTTIKRPQRMKDGPETIEVNIVQALEIDPPPDCEPVHWKLATTEPIATRSDLEHVVDCYRARWTIEDFFKAIKTGCAYEKRRMESLHTLLNTLAILVPIAWRLLLLRTLSRQTPDVPAKRALTKTQLAILAKRRYGGLPARATVREAMLAIARLGGLLKQNGEPGWIVLGRGFEDLLKLEEGYLAAKEDI